MGNDGKEEIPALNLFMMCKAPDRSAFREAPPGYRFRNCRPDELDFWKLMHFDVPPSQAVRDAYLRYMTEYFTNVYAVKGDLFYEKCLFVCGEDDKPVGSCFIWKAYDAFNTIHWLKVLKECEGLGLGRALLTAVMRDLDEDGYPVYLHTHPSSYRAIKLYSDFGFRLLTDPVIGYRRNDLDESMPILRKYMPEKDFNSLKYAEAPRDFLDAALSTEYSQF